MKLLLMKILVKDDLRLEKGLPLESESVSKHAIGLKRNAGILLMVPTSWNLKPFKWTTLPVVFPLCLLFCDFFVASDI